MRFVLVLVVILPALGCSRGEDPQDNRGAAAQPREAGAAAASSSGKLPPGWWEARSVLPERKGAGPFEGRELSSPILPRAQRAREAAPIPQAPAGPPPPPYAYIGKVARDGEGYAVLARDERVFVVGIGDAVGNGYRVESINEREVVLFNLDFRMTQALAFSASAFGSNAVLPATAAAARANDDVSLQVSGPSQVAVGEQFTFTVSLDSGMSAVLDAGRIEVRFDPKVLEIPGQNSSSGAARIDITGAYAGHPAPATLQFRVVAGAPTATEIRVVPTNISDSEGRNVGVNTPQAHRLRIVRAAAAGG